MIRVWKAVLLSLLLAIFSLSASATQNTPSDEDLLWDLSNYPVVAILLPGMSHHFQKPENTSRQWNETHSGIGLEWRTNLDETRWYRKAAIGVMQDSVNSWGAYSGLVWQKRVFEGHGWAVDAGGGLFLFYRALHFDGKHQWLPGALPALSVEHKKTGIGLNIVYVPNFKTDAGEMPAVLFAQFTKRF